MLGLRSARVRNSKGKPQQQGNDEGTTYLLEGQLVASVLPSVDNIEARNRKGVGVAIPGDVSIVLPQWNLLVSCAGFGGSEGNTKDCVSAKVTLVGSTVQGKHGIVNSPLIGGVHSNQLCLDLSVDVIHSLGREGGSE